MFRDFDKEKSLKKTIILGFLSIALSYIFIIPVFEGFDETAHYSYIKFLFYNKKIPDFRYDNIDLTINYETEILPFIEENHNFENKLTYSGFMNLPDSIKKEASKTLFYKKIKNDDFIQSNFVLWQAQHPPLYYLIMTVPYFMIRHFPLYFRIIYLRIFSLMFVFLSFLILFKIVLLFSDKETRLYIYYSSVIILFIPSFFFEISRIGNDNLLILLSSLTIYYVILITIKNQYSKKNFVLLSIFISLGLLTKLLFLPFTIGIFLWIAIDYFFIRKIKNYSKIIKLFLISISIILLFTFWWYILYYIRYGMFVGTYEKYYYPLQHYTPGLELNIIAFVKQIFRSIFAFGATYFWCGTWSWIHRPLWFYIFVFPFIFLIIFSLAKVYVNENNDIKKIIQMSIFILFIILLGFLYFMIYKIIYTGEGKGVGGYYLFFVWFLSAFIMATIFKIKKFRIFILFSLILLLYFDITGWAFSSKIFAGQLVKSALTKQAIGKIPFFIDYAVFEKLKYIVMPYLSIVLYFIGIVSKLFLLYILKNEHRTVN